MKKETEEKFDEFYKELKKIKTDIDFLLKRESTLDDVAAQVLRIMSGRLEKRMKAIKKMQRELKDVKDPDAIERSVNYLIQIAKVVHQELLKWF